ncbi:hypothetical protein COCNU_scaffold001734G000020 [Cocos nucifera]|nr:hypothetical protein [Cocos nucifera]
MHDLLSFSDSNFSSAEMTPEKQNRLAKGLKSLKRKDSSIGEISKKARTTEPIPIVPIQAVPIPESDMAAPPPISS